MGEIISDRLDQERFRENKALWNLTSENAESYLPHVKLTIGAKLYVGEVNGMSREQMQSSLSGTFPVPQAASCLTPCTQSNNSALTEWLLCAPSSVLGPLYRLLIFTTTLLCMLY